MSSAAAVLPTFASHPLQVLSTLAGIFFIGLGVVVALILLFLFFREFSAARIFRGRQFPDTDFSARRKPPAKASLNYVRGQFQGRRKSFAL